MHCSAWYKDVKNNIGKKNHGLIQRDRLMVLRVTWFPRHQADFIEHVYLQNYFILSADKFSYRLLFRKQVIDELR